MHFRGKKRQQTLELYKIMKRWSLENHVTFWITKDKTKEFKMCCKNIKMDDKKQRLTYSNQHSWEPTYDAIIQRWK